MISAPFLPLLLFGVLPTLQGNGRLPARAPVTVVLSEKNKGPYMDRVAVVSIKNNTDKPIEIHSNSPFKIWAYFDLSVKDEKDGRLSAKYHWGSISDPFSESRLVNTIPAVKSIDVQVPLFAGIAKDKLKAGKYKCRITFKNRDINIEATSKEIEIELSDTDLKK